MRQQELLGGMKRDVGVKVFGDDVPTLARMRRRALPVPGASDVRTEP